MPKGPTDLAVIYGTFGSIDVVARTLPTVVEDVASVGGIVIVHDATTPAAGRNDKWRWLTEFTDARENVFLLLSSPVSMGQARNTCLEIAQQQFCAGSIAMMEDDHGFEPGFARRLMEVMGALYGKLSPNGFRYGMFSGCGRHRHGKTEPHPGTDHRFPPINSDTRPEWIGGCNSCFRAAPSHHWCSVLKGYDVDEYPISTFQTVNANKRNYHRGYTSLLIDNGSLMFNLESESRGWDETGKSGLWDDRYAATDLRANFRAE